MGKFHEWVYQDLTLYVRTVAWWKAVPVDPEQRASKDRKSRLKARQEDDQSFEMPLPMHEPEFGYLLAALFDAGPLSPSGMSASTLTWGDIEVWERGTGWDLHPWERKVMRRLSSDYSTESHMAEKPKHPCPYQPDEASAADLTSTAMSMRNALRGLAKL